MTARISLILQKVGAHVWRLRAVALALRGAPLQKTKLVFLLGGEEI